MKENPSHTRTEGSSDSDEFFAFYKKSIDVSAKRNDEQSEDDADAVSYSPAILPPPSPGRRVKQLIVGLGIFLVCTALVGSVLFRGVPFFGSDSILLSIDAKKTIASGEKISYIISYRNTDSRPLTNLSMRLAFPPGFSFLDASLPPENTNSNVWSLGALASRQGGELIVNGALVGEKDEEKTLKAILYYSVPDAVSEFIKESSFTTTLQTSVFVLALEGPAAMKVAEQASFTMYYGNFSQTPIAQDVALEIELPEGFSYVRSEPLQDSDAHSWNARTLLQHIDSEVQTGTVRFWLKLEKAASAPSQLIARLVRVHEGQRTVLIEKVHDISTQKGVAELSLTVNKSPKNEPVSFGEQLSLALRIKNTGGENMTNSILSAEFTSPLIDWATLNDPNVGIVDGTTITWSSREISDLSVLQPGQESTILLSLGIKSASNAQGFLETLERGAGVNVTIRSSAKSDQEELVPIVLNLPVSSDARFRATVQKDAGPKGFMLTLTLDNSLHELSNLLITGILGEGVSVPHEPTISAGIFQKAEGKEKFRWTINRLPLGVQTLMAQIPFEVQGESGFLIKSLMFTAKDTKTGGKIQLTPGNIPAQIGSY